MAKAPNGKPSSFSTKAAKAPTVNQTIGPKPIRTFSGPSLKGSHVGPKNAPFHEVGPKSAFGGKN